MLVLHVVGCVRVREKSDVVFDEGYSKMITVVMEFCRHTLEIIRRLEHLSNRKFGLYNSSSNLL